MMRIESGAGSGRQTVGAWDARGCLLPVCLVLACIGCSSTPNTGPLAGFGGLGASGFGAAGVGASGFGASGFGASGFGASGFGGLGVSGLGVSGFGVGGLGGFGVGGLGGFGAGGFGVGGFGVGGLGGFGPPILDCPNRPGFADCENSGSCDTNVMRSRQHCGGCNRLCNVPQAADACVSGRCRLVECDSGQNNCDGNPLNGCETQGPCLGLVQPGCDPGMGDCNMDGTCDTNLMRSERHCGFCGNICDPPRASSRCVSGVCTITNCNGDFNDCDLNALNGCETQGPCR